MAGGKGRNKGKGKKRPGGKPSQARSPSAGGPARTPPPPPAAAGAGASNSTKPTRSDKAPKPTRTERLDAARRARRRKALMVRFGAAGAVLAVVAVVATLVAADKRAESAERKRLTAGSCEFDTRNDRLTVNKHVAPPDYEVDPPAGGDHSSQAARAGIYGDQNPAPPDPQLVHSLEHGFVVLWHRPGLGEEDMAAIRGVHQKHSEDVLVVPRPSLKHKVAATSWGRRLLCDEIEPDTLEEFVTLYRNKSPEPGRRP